MIEWVQYVYTLYCIDIGLHFTLLISHIFLKLLFQIVNSLNVTICICGDFTEPKRIMDSA